MNGPRVWKSVRKTLGLNKSKGGVGGMVLERVENHKPSIMVKLYFRDVQGSRKPLNVYRNYFCTLFL